MKRKANRKSEAQVDPELKGLAISVNEFGEVVANVAIDKLNDFLDRKVVDRKLEEKKQHDRLNSSDPKKGKQRGK